MARKNCTTAELRERRKRIYEETSAAVARLNDLQSPIYRAGVVARIADLDEEAERLEREIGRRERLTGLSIGLSEGMAEAAE